MKINILGPVEVWVNGDQVRLARRQQRLIVGMLALQSNRWVPADMLIEALWGQRAPAAARSILRTRVSEVRSALGPASGPLAITTSSGAYRLQAGPDCLDVQQFTQLLEQAKGAAPPARRTMLTDALALWRGPVLGGNGVEQVWVPLVGALESDRLTAVEDLLEAELELHNHRQVADSALRYALANPSRERITVQAMRALAAADRDADALRLYEQSRRWLRDELGLDPTSAMQQLYLDILHRADPATPPVTIVPTGAAGPAAAPAPASDETAAVRPVVAGADASQFLPASPNLLPPDLPDFTGRATEQARLHELLTEEGTTSRVVAIIGPGGVGKTTLAIRAARALLSCYPDGQLYADLNGLTQDAAAQPADVLARFLRALGVEGTGLPENLDELADLYRNLLSHRRVLILLDNASSDGQVAPLIPGNPGCAVIATSRSRIGGTIAATPIELDVFNSAEARTLLTRVIGDHRVSAEESAVAELSQQCGFLPLAIRIAAAKLATKDHWSVAKLVDMLSDENHRLGHFTHGRLGVPAALSLSYQGLPADADHPRAAKPSASLLGVTCAGRPSPPHQPRA